MDTSDEDVNGAQKVPAYLPHHVKRRSRASSQENISHSGNQVLSGLQSPLRDHGCGQGCVATNHPCYLPGVAQRLNRPTNNHETHNTFAQNHCPLPQRCSLAPAPARCWPKRDCSSLHAPDPSFCRIQGRRECGHYTLPSTAVGCGMT